MAELRPERRQRVVEQLVDVLRGAERGSRVALRGSLADGTADQYSDIDLCWVVPDARFAEAAATVADLLPTATARVDPAFARSDRRRLVFLRLPGLPVFWRIDLDIRAASVAGDDDYDAGNLDARDDERWSPHASALENAIAAVKAQHRGRAETADGLLRRGFARIGLPGTGTARELADACVAGQPDLAGLAEGLTKAG